MKRLLTLVALGLAAVAFLLLPMLALGQPDKAPRGLRGFAWVTYPENPGQAFLLFGKVTVGGWDHAAKIYRPFNGLAWGEPRKAPPIRPPAPPAAPMIEQQLPTGVDSAKLQGSGEPRYWRRGTPISKGEASAAVGAGGKLQDDRDKLRLTVIGPDSDRAGPVKDLPADLKSKVNVWSVPPDHWSVAGMGFVVSGKPTIYLTAPDGKVLLRQDAGPLDVGALRKAVDGYDSKKDPGPNGPKLAAKLFADLENVPGYVWTALVLAGAYFLMQRKAPAK